LAKAKVRKLIKVAKELNLAISTLSAELEKEGFEVTKKQMTPIPDDVYEGLLKRFAPELWANMQADLAREEVEEKEREARAIRNADLQKILDTGAAAAEKKPQPSVRHLEPGEVIQAADTAGDVEVPHLTADVILKPSKAKKSEKKETIKEDNAEEAVTIEAVTIEEEKPEPQKKQKPKPVVREVSEEFLKTQADSEKGWKTKRASVRGEISNDDIKKFQPPSKTAVKEVVVKPVKAEEEKAKETGEEEKKSKRKRKRKPKRGAAKERAGLEAEGPKVIKTITEDASASKRKRKRGKKKKVDVKEVEASIKQTMAAMEDHSKKKKKRRVSPDVGILDEETNLLQITEFVSTTELAQLIEVPVSELIRECLLLGLRVTINQRLDKDTIQLLAEEHDYQVEFVDQVEEEDLLEAEDITEEEGELVPRAPVVTIMGHVDHGKTSLLDYLRSSSIIDGEAGGITQHIGAYRVIHNNREITFLDTPGHEAFTAMRARGAQVTDIVVLVVAADDQVMPQTIEAIDHARAANVPMVVAINKMDKEGADAEKVRRKLSEYDLIVEEYGGDVQSAEISAKTGMGIDDLLEKILIASDILELKAVKDSSARGTIIESRLDKGRGTVCTILVQRGTLHVGNVFVAGPHLGRIRAMFDEHGNKQKEVSPGQPIEITGIDKAPHVGDPFIVYADEKEAKEVSTKRQLQLREQEMRLREGFIKVDLLTSIDELGKRYLNLIIKGDVDGSVEAIADSLMRLSIKDLEVNIIHRSVGPINESNILLASTSHAMIIGFNIHPNIKAREMAQNEGVTIQTYHVIYELIDDIKGILKGMRKRRYVDEVVGTIEVRNTFKISKIGMIAGCYVLNGKIERTNRVRVLRDSTQVYQGNIETLRRFKDDAREVLQGFECGIKVANFNDIKVGDILESVIKVELEEELEVEA